MVVWSGFLVVHTLPTVLVVCLLWQLVMQRQLAARMHDGRACRS